MEQFEKILKEKLHQLEEPNYNPKHWDAVRQKLRLRKIALGAIISVVALSSIAVAAYLTNPEAPKNNEIAPVVTPGTKNTSIETENTIEFSRPSANKKEAEHRPESEPNQIREPKQNISLEEKTTEQEKANSQAVKPHKPQEEVIETKQESIKRPKLEAFISASVQSACVFESIAFKYSSDEPVNITWHFGDGKKSLEPSPKHNYSKPGTYYPRAEIESLLDGKVTEFYLDDPVVVNPIPEAVINYKLNKSNSLTRDYTFSLESDVEIMSYKWENSTNNTNSFTKEINQKGAYVVSVEISDANGCSNLIKRTITVDTDYNLFAPTAFTPDNDGTNDHFIPEALESVEDGQFIFTVVDPNTGRTLHESKSFSNPWNGKNPTTGNVASPGTYIWTVKLFLSDQSKNFSGTVQIID